MLLRWLWIIRILITISTAFAATKLPAFPSSVVAFTVFFLTTRFPTAASLVAFGTFRYNDILNCRSSGIERKLLLVVVVAVMLIFSAVVVIQTALAATERIALRF